MGLYRCCQGSRLEGEEVDVAENTFCRFNNSCGSTTLQTSGQSTVGSANVDHKTRQQLEQTAQIFVEAYRKRKDFRDCFEAFFVRDAVDRMKLSGFLKSMDMDPALIQNATTDELAHAYVAMMNYHFASLAYEFNYPKAPWDVFSSAPKMEH